MKAEQNKPKEEKPSYDKETLQGRWQVVSVEAGGKETQESGVEEAWTVKGDQITAHAKGQSFFLDRGSRFTRTRIERDRH